MGEAEPREMNELLQLALDRMKAKGAEHNNFRVSFASYCPFGNLSAATLLHREALRICIEAERDNQAGVDEHLVDLVVFSILMWNLNHPANLTSKQSECLNSGGGNE